MISILTNGRPVYIPDHKKKFQLTERLNFIGYSEAYPIHLNTTYFVPKGFETDLASVPNWIFWWQWGKWNLAAIVHDYLYCHGYLFKIAATTDPWESDSSIQKFSKQEADLLFYEMCQALGVDRVTSILMYLAVKIFGRNYGNQKTGIRRQG